LKIDSYIDNNCDELKNFMLIWCW